MWEKSQGVLRGQQSSQKEEQAPGFRSEGVGRGVQYEETPLWLMHKKQEERVR